MTEATPGNLLTAANVVHFMHCVNKIRRCGSGVHGLSLSKICTNLKLRKGEGCSDIAEAAMERDLDIADSDAEVDVEVNKY
jgi:hypothetical protein